MSEIHAQSQKFKINRREAQMPILQKQRKILYNKSSFFSIILCKINFRRSLKKQTKSQRDALANEFSLKTRSCFVRTSRPPKLAPQISILNSLTNYIGKFPCFLHTKSDEVLFSKNSRLCTTRARVCSGEITSLM